MFYNLPEIVTELRNWPEGRLLAVDYGGQRVGIALSDPQRQIATPQGTWPNDKLLVGKICNLVQEERVLAIIIGLPLLHPEGNPTAMANYIDFTKLNDFPPHRVYRNSNLPANLVNIFNFALQLNQKLASSLPIFFVDESYSSAEADEFLRENFPVLNRKQRTAKLDAMAASYILSRFLQQLII